jgi:hypothetical protein
MKQDIKSVNHSFSFQLKMKQFKFIRYFIGATMLLCFASHGFSQGKIKPSDYPVIFAKVDSLLKDFNEYSTFKDLENNPNEISSKYAEKFKSLFTSDAIIADELCIKYFDSDKNLSSYLQYENRSVDDYILKRKNTFSDGLDDIKVVNTDISYREIALGHVTVIMERYSKATLPTSYITISSHPIFTIDLQFSNNFSELKITSIRMVSDDDSKKVRGYKHSKNDEDLDFISDNDEDKRYPGLKEASGHPNAEEVSYLRTTGISFDANFNIDLSLSYGMDIPSISINDFNNSALFANYDRASEDWNSTNKFSESQMNVQSILSAGITGTYYFGVLAKVGLTSGINWSQINAEISNKNLIHISYRAEDTTGTSYRRIISSKGITENYTASYLSVPLMGKYKFNLRKISNKLSFELGAGVNMNLNMTAMSSDPTGTFTYEAIYTAQQETGKFPTYEYLNQEQIDASNNVYLWNIEDGREDVNYVAQREGLDLGVDKTLKMTDKKTVFKGGIGAIVSPTLYYKIGNKMFAALGFTYATNTFSFDKAAEYRITDKVGEYHSLLQSVPKFSMPVLSFNFSIRYAFIK